MILFIYLKLRIYYLYGCWCLDSHSIITKYQCITVRHGTACYRFVHSSALFLCIFFPYFSLVTFFMSHFFHVVLFLCCTFFVLHSFCVALWSSGIISMWHFFMLHYFILQFSRDALFSCYSNFKLHFSRGTLFSRCTFFMFYLFSCCFMVHSVHVALFCCCTLLGCTFSYFFHTAPFFVLLHVELFSCCSFFALHSFCVALFPCCSFFMLHSCHVAPFSCCTILMLQFFQIALFSCFIFFIL